MAFDLATAKTRHGILGVAQDADVLAAIEASWNIVEAYCQRGLRYQAGVVEKQFRRSGETVKLYRYPIVTVNAVIDTRVARNYLPTQDYEQDDDAGVLHFIWPYDTLALRVEYDGGYQTLPWDLEQGMWAVFDKLWGQWGAAGGGASTLSSVTLQDVGTVRFDNGSSASSSSTADDFFGTAMVTFLNPYRDIPC